MRFFLKREEVKKKSFFYKVVNEKENVALYSLES